jgi:hypothetical protein
MAKTALDLTTSLYEKFPQAFTDDEVNALALQRKQAGLPFQRDEEATPFNLINTVKQLGEGFIQGFTTIQLGEDPQNTIEGIARSVGSLLGFVGFIPGPGIFRKFRTAGAAGVTSVLAADRMGIQLKSVPMYFADKMMGGLDKFLKGSEAFKASSFFAKDSGKLVKDMVEGSLHLGIASAISAAQPWELEPEKRIEGFIGGAEFGAAFRGIGNLFAKGALDMGSPAANMLARAFSASLYSGVPSTMRGDPTEMQVYEYLLGAWFGKNEMPSYQRQAQSFLKPFWGDRYQESKLLNPKKIEGFDKLMDNAKIEVLSQADLLVGRYNMQLGMSESGIAAGQAAGEVAEEMIATGQWSMSQYMGFRRAEQVQAIFKASKESVDKSQPGLSEEERTLVARNQTREILSDVVEKEEELKTKATILTVDGLKEAYLKQTAGQQVAQMFQDKEVSARLTEPIFEIAKLLETNRGEADKKNVLNYTSELIGHVVNSKGSLDTFLKRVQDEYSLEPQKDARLNRDLVQGFAMAKQYRPIRQLQLTPQGEVQDRLDKDVYGSPTIRLGAPTHVDEIVGTPGYLLETGLTESRRKKGISTFDETPIHRLGYTTSELIHNAYNRVGTKQLKNGKVLVPDPLLYWGGVKDKSSMVFYPSVVDVAPDGSWRYTIGKKEVTTTLREKLYSMGEDARDNYQQGLEQYIREITKGEQIIPSKRDNLVGEYEHITMQQIALMEKLNAGITIGEQVNEAREYQGGVTFLAKATDFNKRMQPLTNRDPKAEAVNFADIVPDGKMKGLIVAIEGDAGGNPRPGSTVPVQKTYDERTGEMGEKIYDENSNGVLVVENSVFDRFVASMGNKGTGSAKVTVIFTDPKGLFIGKLAMHRPSPEMQKSLQEQNAHYAIFTTAAKQFGRRAVHEQRYENGKFTYSKVMGGTPTLDELMVDFQKRDTRLGTTDFPFKVEGDTATIGWFSVRDQRQGQGTKDLARLEETLASQGVSKLKLQQARPDSVGFWEKQGFVRTGELRDPSIKDPVNGDLIGYTMEKQITPRAGILELETMPVDSVRMNFGASETGETGDVKVKKQFGDSLNGQLSLDWDRVLLDPISRGSAYHNELLAKYMNVDPERRKQIEDEIDVTQLGAQEILEIAAGKRRGDHEIYRKVMREILNFRVADINREGLQSDETQEEMQWLLKARTAADRVKATGIVHPLVMEMKQVKPYVHTMIKKYLENKFLAPTMEGSFSSQLYHADLSVMPNVREGVYLAAAGLKEKPVLFLGKTVKMEEAWKTVQEGKFRGKTLTSDQLREAEDDLTHFVIRVPADSPSGIRILRMGGFVETEGTGVYLHPRDMVAIGGSDLDGDKADIYTRIHAKGTFFNREFNTRVKQYFADPRIRDQWYTKEGYMRKVNSALLEDTVPPEVKTAHGSKSSVVMPIRRAEANLWAYNGNQTLGPALSHMIRLRELVGKTLSTGAGKVAGDVKNYHLLRLIAEGEVPGREQWGPNVLPAVERELAARSHDFDFINNAVALAGYRKGNSWTAEIGDPQELWNTRRNVVNTAADAAKGNKLRPFKDIEGRLNKGPFKNLQLTLYRQGKDGKTEKITIAPKENYNVIDAHPYVAAIRKLGEFAVGKNWEEGRPYTLYSSIENLKKTMNELTAGGKTPYEPTAVRFHAYKRLAALRLNADDIDNIHILGPGWYASRGVADRIMMSEHGLQLALRKHVGVDTGGEEAAAAKMPVGAGRSLTQQNTINELRLQDLQDIATFAHLNDVGEGILQARLKNGEKKEAVLAQFEAIGRQLDKLRYKDAALRKQDPRLEEEIVRKQATLEYIVDQARKLRMSLPPDMVPYFDAYATGSLFHQAEAFESIQGIKELRKAINTAKSAGDNDTAHKLELQLAEARQVWDHTNAGNFAYALEIVSPEAIRAHVKALTDIGNGIAEIDSRTTATPWMFEILRPRILKSSISKELADRMPFVNQMNGPVESMTITNDFISRIAEYEKVPLTDPDMVKLKTDLKNVFLHVPEVLRHVERVFDGFSSASNPSGIGVSIQNATKAQMRDMVNRFKYNGKFWWDLPDAERRFALAKRHFFWDPEYLGEAHMRGDLRLVETAAPIMDARGGAVMKPVYQMTSTMGEIANIAAQLHRAENGALMIQAKKLDEDLITVRGTEEGHRLWELNTDIRQMRLIDTEKMTPEGVEAYKTNGKNAQAAFYKEFDRGNRMLRFVDKNGAVSRITAAEALKRIDASQTEYFERWLKIISNPEAEAKHFRYLGDPSLKLINVDETTRDLNSYVQKATAVPDIGVEGMYKFIHAIAMDKIDTAVVGGEGPLKRYNSNPQLKAEMIKQLINYESRDGSRPYEWLIYKPLQVLSPSAYYPHNGHPSKMVESQIQHELARLKQFANGPDAVADKNVQRLTEYNDLNNPDMGMSETLMKILETRTLGPNDMATLRARPAALRHRTDLPLPGWDKSVRALETYQSQILKGYYNMASAILSDYRIRDFEARKPFGNETEPWTTFMRIYVRNNLGHPSTFPQEWLDNPRYQIKNNPFYYFLTDQYWLDKAAEIDAAHFKPIKSPRTLKEAVQAKEIEVNRQKRIRQIATLSNLEAKWQMISLLSHTKTMVNNVVGGTTNTLISTGWGPWRKAHNFEYLRGIFPNATSMTEIHQWAEQHGSGESWINDMLEASGLGLQPKWAGFVKEFKSNLKFKEKFSDIDLEHLAQKNGIVRGVFDSGAWFMRKSERYLRNKAFIAHYIKAREALDANFQMDPNDPWLITMANRGVKASQFLYNNASRPAFARTSLGKIFTRFQMWAWNSIKMRMDVNEQAREVGYQIGSPQYERLKRLALADLFVFGLAGLFPSTMFSASLAAPWSQFQDFASFLFGNDEDKEKAFYGSLPYPANIVQPISPPVTRPLYSVFGSLVSGDWDRFLGYHVWTWFPFGRMANSVRKAAETPEMSIEQFTGIPIHRIGADARKSRDREAIANGIISGLMK